jgi:hypothetical protein
MITPITENVNQAVTEPMNQRFSHVCLPVVVIGRGYLRPLQRAWRSQPDRLAVVGR